MTVYEELTLKLKLCELCLGQVGLELEYNGHSHMETEAVLEQTQENIMLLSVHIEKACDNAKTE